MNIRIDNLEKWRNHQEHSLIEVVANTTLLRESTAKVTALLDGQDRRLILLEDNQRWTSRPQ